MSDKNTLVIEREFDAPLDVIWKYWSDPEYMKQWWGPKDFTAPHVTIDFRVGGKVLSCMRGVGAPGMGEQDFWSTGTYKEIVPPSSDAPKTAKIVCTDSFADEKGNIVSAETYGMSGFPLELEVTTTFIEENGKTKMILEHRGIEHLDPSTKENMTQGWNQSFDKIVDKLKS